MRRQSRAADMIIACNAGKIQYYARNYRAAVEKYKEALKLDPDFRKTHWDLGLAYVQLGKRDAALRQFDPARSLTDDGRDLLAARAYAYASAGDAGQARTMLAQLEPLAQRKSIAYEIAAVYAALSQSEKDSAAGQGRGVFLAGAGLPRAFRLAVLHQGRSAARRPSHRPSVRGIFASGRPCGGIGSGYAGCS